MEKLVLGTVQMGIDYGVNNKSGKVSLESSHEILLEASKAGITTLDSAEAYGNAHQVIGEFHRSNSNVNFKIITKIPHDFRHDQLNNKIKNYINDLGVLKIDTLMFHSFDSYKKNKNAITILKKLQLEGIIKQIGVSVYTNNQIEQLINDEDITIVQMPFNLLDNISIRGDYIKKLKLNGKEVHTRSVFLQGLFFKKYNENNKIVKKLQSELKILNNIRESVNCTMEELALSYCNSQIDIDKIIIGVDSLTHLKSNLSASRFLLGEKEINAINSIKVFDLDSINPTLWN